MRRTDLVQVLLLPATIAALFALAACDGDSGEPPGSDPDRIQGGRLTVQGVEFSSLDPHFSSFVEDISLQRMLWRGLYLLDASNQPQPMMAAAQPEISADGTTYTVHLKPGLQWSDGDDLLAEDFAQGIKRTCNPDVAGEYEYVLDVSVAGCADHYNNEAGFDQALEDAIGVTAVDATTLAITLNQPQPTFTTVLALWMTFPMPVHLMPETGAEWPSDPARLAYNGPYTLREYAPQDHVTLVPNLNWAGDIDPTLDELVIRFIDDTAAANRAYRTGELDASQADQTQLATLEREFESTAEYVTTSAPVTDALVMQLGRPPLDQLNVRLALARAIDRETLNTVVAGGGNEPTTTWLPPATGGPPPDAFADTIGFDPLLAREHLAAAGFENGENFPTLGILISDDPVQQATAEFMQAAFKEILNIDTEIEVADEQTGPQRIGEGDFDLWLGGWAQDYPDPENWLLGQFDTGGSLNSYGCSDAEIDDLITTAQFNTNNAQRIGKYLSANQLVVTRVCGVAPYWHASNHALVKPHVAGMRENSTGQDAILPGDWFAEAWGRSE